MKTILFFVVITWSLNLKATEIRYLTIGQSLAISSSPYTPVQIQKRSLLKVKDKGQSLLFIGKKLGSTKVQIGKDIYEIKVLHKNVYQTLQQLQAWKKNKRGPKLEVNPKKLFIKGRFLTTADFWDLQNYTTSDSKFLIRASWSRRLQVQLKKEIQTFLQNHNRSFDDLTFSPHLQMSLAKNKKDVITLFKKQMAPFGIEVLSDHELIPLSPLIEVKIYIAHISRNFLRRLGVRWPTQLQANLGPAGSLQIENLQWSLQSLESTGEGQLLATPTLITESGKKAEFHSGGEIPIVTSTQFTNDVQWKRYGLFVKTKPFVNTKRHLQIEIDLQLSTLDSASSTGSIPGLIQSELKTQVHMKTPRPIFLSGLIRKAANKNKSGLPFLKEIPIFAPLFAENEIFKSEMELVFILIPKFYEQ
ncbi:MAG: hypothetical protein AAF203_04550 [Pseudomonadota bacterium]